MQITNTQLDSTRTNSDDIEKDQLDQITELRMRIDGGLDSIIRGNEFPLVKLSFEQLAQLVENGSLAVLTPTGQAQVANGQPVFALGGGSAPMNSATPSQPASVTPEQEAFVQAMQAAANQITGGDFNILTQIVMATLGHIANAPASEHNTLVVGLQDFASGRLQADHEREIQAIQAELDDERDPLSAHSLANQLATANRDLSTMEGERDTAIGERDTAIGERDTAVNAATSLITERDQARAVVDDIKTHTRKAAVGGNQVIEVDSLDDSTKAALGL